MCQKKFITPFISLSLILIMTVSSNTNLGAVVALQSEHLKESSVIQTKKLASTAKSERKDEKLHRRLEKLAEKISEKAKKWMAATDDYWEDDYFRLGLLLIAAGMLISLIFASWLSWIGGLAVVGGLVLVILVLLGY